MMVGKQGNVLLLNGQREGTIVVESGGRQRWRFINSANGRYFNLRVPGHPFVVVGGDGGLLPTSYTTDTLLIVPGERYEVIVAFDDAEDAHATLETIYYDRGHELPDQGPRLLANIVVGPRVERALRPLPTALRTIEPLAITASTIAKRFELQENENGVRDQYFATSAKACRGWLSLENASLGSVGYGGAVAGMATNCSDRSLYDRLTQLDAWQEPGAKPMKYVTPNDPTNSYLYQKVANGTVGEASPGVASVNMPPNAPLSATDVAMVKKWIETGAPK